MTNAKSGDIYEPAFVKTFAGFLHGNSKHLFGITRSRSGELNVYACPIGVTFFDELCLLMIGVAIDHYLLLII